AHRTWLGGTGKQPLDLGALYEPQEGREDLRGFEWHYLRNLCREPPGEQVTLRGHTDQVFYVSYSPDGKLLATCSQDRTARLWDVATGKVLRTFEGYQDDVN